MCEQRITENEILIFEYNLPTMLEKNHNMQLHLPGNFYRVYDAKLL